MTSSIVLTRPLAAKKSATGSTIAGLQTSVINGQPMLTLADTTRANKVLSVAEQILTFSRNQLGVNEWFRVGNTTDAKSGFVAEFDGTICFATGHCEDARGNSKNVHVFINGADQGSIGTLTAPEEATFVNTTLNIDYSQGDVVRLRAIGPDKIEDTIIKVTIKHRA